MLIKFNPGDIVFFAPPSDMEISPGHGCYKDFVPLKIVSFEVGEKDKGYQDRYIIDGGDKITKIVYRALVKPEDTGLHAYKI